MFHQFGTVTSADGTILVFAEGRIGTGEDSGNPHHICAKRSLDGGRTWGSTIIVADARKDKCAEDENQINDWTGHCYAIPIAVVEQDTGRIFLLYAKNYHNEYTRLYVTHSDDDGLTWAFPKELEGLFNGDPYSRQFHLPGPGHGIQTNSGRLIVTVWHRLRIALEEDNRLYGLSVLYSDDGGKTVSILHHLAT